jgi:hypothetical protein
MDETKEASHRQKKNSEPSSSNYLCVLRDVGGGEDFGVGIVTLQCKCVTVELVFSRKVPNGRLQLVATTSGCTSKNFFFYYFTQAMEDELKIHQYWWVSISTKGGKYRLDSMSRTQMYRTELCRTRIHLYMQSFVLSCTRRKLGPLSHILFNPPTLTYHLPTQIQIQ